MADPYEGLSADQWKKALQEVRAQIPGMRQEAAALNKELASGRKTVKDIEAAGRRGATIGAGARAPDPKTVTAQTEKQALAAERVARAEAQVAAARQRSLDVLRRAGLIVNTGPYQAFGTPAAIARQTAQYERLLALQSRLGGTGGGAFIGGSGGGGGFSRRALPPGPPPRLALPAGPPPPLALPAAGQSSYVGGMREINKETAKANIGTGAFSSNLQRNQAVLAASSREMRKFGALTTEFISAAGRGAVTVRELGFQVSSTIGKFGGWLGAGAAVYGAFAAISAVGRGAIDTQSGIAQLSRVVSNVNADDAAEQFRDLASSFNLPIEEVSGAAFEMGKVFEDQNDALEATKAVLASVKVGELDVATSSRYLTSIIQAFNLPASQMAGVFDQVNQAQNQFGIRIEDTLAGLAKASGTFKAAGGDLSTLLALITTARRATGQTGEVIGTALARAPNFLRQENNQKVLEAFGIDATQTITGVIDDAFAKARGLSGAKLQELAAAIFGPQYGARVGTPLLQQGDLYQKVLADTSPEAAKGSAQRELQSVLAQTSEQLRKVIVQLEVMGSALAQAGAFDAFGLLLKTLNLTLTTVNSILDVFNELPSPIRRAVTYMGQFVALIALARRFNVGQSFQGTGAFSAAGRRLFTRRNQEGFLYKEALVGQQSTLSAEAEGASTAAVRRSLEVEAARLTVTQEQAALARQTAAAKAGAVVTEEAITEQQLRVVAAENQLAAARETELGAMTKNQAILRQQLIVQSQLTALKNGANATTLAAAHGVIIPGTVGADAATAARLADPNIQRSLAPDLVRAQSLVIAQDLRAHAVMDPSRMKRMQTALAANMRQYGVLGGAIATGNQAVRSSAQKASVALRTLNFSRIGAAARGFGSTLKRAASAITGFLGPLDLILIGGFLLLDSISKGQAKVGEMEASLSSARTATDAATFSKGLNDTIKTVEDTGGWFHASDLFGPIQAADEKLAQAERLSHQRNNQLIGVIKRRRGTKTSRLFAEDFQRGIDAMVNVYEDSNGNAQRLAKDAQNLISIVRAAENLTDREKTETIQQIRQAQVEARGTRSTYEELAGLGGEGLAASISEYGDAVASGFSTQKQRRELLQRALVQGAELINSTKPEDAALVAQAFEDSIGSLTDAAQAELDRALLFAKGQAERNEAYDAYLDATNPAQVRQQSQALINQQKRRLEQSQKSRQLARGDLEQLRNQSGGLLTLASGIGGAALKSAGFDSLGSLVGARGANFGAAVQPLIDELKKRGETNEEIRKQIDGLRKAQKVALEQLKAIRKQARDARFEEDQAAIEARGDLAAGRAAEGLPSLRINLNVIDRLVQRAIEHYGRDSKEVLDLISQRQSARDAIVQEQMTLIQANADYAAAGFTGEGQELQRQQAEIDGLYRELAFAQSHARQYSAGDVRNIQAQIRESEAALAQAAEEQAEALRGALYDVRIARAEARGNEVAVARRTLNKALYELRSADTPEERAEGRANVIRQRAALRDSIFSRQLEDIEFQADIGNLTLDQQIKAYQQLLRTAEITRDQRRDLRRRIFQLKEEADQASGDFDLRVGDIKLPTTYEIRRAIQGGINRGTNVAMNQQNNYYVQGSNADEIVNKVARKQEDAARRNRNMARSAGIE